MNKNIAIACGLAPLLAAGTVHASCGSAFCSINTNWGVQGAWTEPGLRADLRYEYINQDQPMNGKNKVSVGQIPMHHDEVHTVNRNWIAMFDYDFGSAWGVSVFIPVVDRDHLHIHNHQGAQIPESWNFTDLGDIRVLARYKFPTHDGADHTLTYSGMIFGLKLPTGKFDVTNAEGEFAERTLQPGSGTTDLIFGGYLQGSLPLKDLSWFAQALYQSALNMRQEFRPGDRFTVDFGLRYDLTQSLGLMLQLNSLFKAKDTGLEAETDDSGGTFVFLSPGISYSVTRDVQVYGFVQFPLYQYVNGVQLTANRAVALGISARF
jgi:hypothetical protein